MFYGVLVRRLLASIVLSGLFGILPTFALADNHCPRPPQLPGYAKRWSCPTHTQTYHPGEPRIHHPGGSPGRGTGYNRIPLKGYIDYNDTRNQAARQGSVYCQQTPDGRVIPQPYDRTKRNIPCGLTGGQPAQRPAIRTMPICSLRDLARLVFQRYQSGGFPIASYRVTNFPQDRYTYLIVAQGIDSFLDFDATKSNVPIQAIKDASGVTSRYAENILEVIRRLDRGPSQLPPRILLSGHSHGGMGAQSVVIEAARGDLRQRGSEVFQIVTFGAPMTLFRQSETRYVQVVAERDTVVDALDLFFRFGMLNGPLLLPGVIRIPGGSNLDLRSPDSSHQIYPRSVELSLYDLEGNWKGAGGREICWVLDQSSLKQYSAPALTKDAPPVDCSVAGAIWSAGIPPVNERHIFCGEIHPNNRVVGYHSKQILPSDVVESVVNEDPIHRDMYDATVNFSNGRNKESTFFPDGCTVRQIVASVQYAANNQTGPATPWGVYGPSAPPAGGVNYCLDAAGQRFDIRMGLVNGGNVNTAFPHFPD